MQLILVSMAYAQEPAAVCELCDWVGPIVYGTPVVFGFIGVALVVALHAWEVSGASRTWRAGRVGALKLWAAPIAVGLLTVLLGLATNFLLAFKYPEFRYMYLPDLQTVPAVATWALVGFGAQFVPFLVASVRAK